MVADHRNYVSGAYTVDSFSTSLSFRPSSAYSVTTTWTYIGFSVGVNKLPFANTLGVHGLMGNQPSGYDIVSGTSSPPNPSNTYFYPGNSVNMSLLGNCMSSGSLREI